MKRRSNGMREEVQRYLQKAEEALGAARTLRDAGYSAEACSRSYYPMHYAAQALLRNSNVRVKKHSAVVAQFGEHFAKTGKIDPIHHETLIKAKKRREIADYDVLAEIDQKTAKEIIDEAALFLREINKHLGREH